MFNFHGMSSVRTSFVFLINALALVLLSGIPVYAAPKFVFKKELRTERAFLGPAVMALVSLDNQTISLYDEHGASLKSSISSGQVNYETPVGIYSVLQKEEEHYSNIYDDASMPFMQRITWSGLSLHAGQLPGYPASHGCVRLPINFAQEIYGQTRMGMRVIVARGDITPKPLSHPALFQPQPKEVDVSNDIKDFLSPPSFSIRDEFLDEKLVQLLPDLQRWPARAVQLENQKKLALYLDRKAQEETAKLELPKKTVEELKVRQNDIKKKLQGVEFLRKAADKELYRTTLQFSRTRKPKEMTLASNARLEILEKQSSLDIEISDLKAELQNATDILVSASDVLKQAEVQNKEAVRQAHEAKLRMLPISVLISLKKQRIYVRQGFEQIMEDAIQIDNPGQPIGTHVYTALGYDESGDKVRWTSVSLKSPEVNYAYNIKTYDEDHQWISDNPSALSEFEDASGALERIKIPDPMRKRISEYVWPGSSLIITDEEPHKETGKATEFIVLISGELQGGIIKRRRIDPSQYYYSDSFFNWFNQDDRRQYDRGRLRFERAQKPQPLYFGWD